MCPSKVVYHTKDVTLVKHYTLEHHQQRHGTMHYTLTYSLIRFLNLLSLFDNISPVLLVFISPRKFRTNTLR